MAIARRRQYGGQVSHEMKADKSNDGGEEERVFWGGNNISLH